MITRHTTQIQSLTESLTPFIDHFNHHQGKLRLLAVLSPTCPR